MPNADIQLYADIIPKLSDKQLSLGLKSFSKKSADIVSQNLTKRFLQMISEGEARTGIGARTAFLRRQGISGSKLNEGAWTILDQAQTRAENIRTGYQKLMRQQKIDEERMLKKQTDQRKKEQADTLWLAKHKALSPITRIKSKLGSTSDYKKVREGLEAELLKMQENGATRQQYDAWKKRVESAYGMGESQLRYNTELEKQAKKTGDKSLLSEKTYKKFQTKELKGIDKLNKTASDNNVKISKTGGGGGFSLAKGALTGGIAGLGLALNKFVLPGIKESIDEGNLRYLYRGIDTAFNEFGKIMKGEELGNAIKSTQMHAADFGMREKYGQVSGMEYNAISRLSSASGVNIASLMRRASQGDTDAQQKVISGLMTAQRNMSSGEYRFYMQQAGFDQNLALLNKAAEEDPEYFMEKMRDAYLEESSRRSYENISNKLSKRYRGSVSTMKSYMAGTATGAAVGGAAGAALTPEFLGVGAIPGAIIGGLAGGYMGANAEKAYVTPPPTTIYNNNINVQQDIKSIKPEEAGDESAKKLEEMMTEYSINKTTEGTF